MFPRARSQGSCLPLALSDSKQATAQLPVMSTKPWEIDTHPFAHSFMSKGDVTCIFSLDDACLRRLMLHWKGCCHIESLSLQGQSG